MKETLELGSQVKQYESLKIGQIANKVLRSVLEEEELNPDEIALLQTREYSKKIFDIQYPLLVPEGNDIEEARYYKNPVIIAGKSYRLCSQWFETTANNDRPYLLMWLHTQELLLSRRRNHLRKRPSREYLIDAKQVTEGAFEQYLRTHPKVNVDVTIGYANGSREKSVWRVRRFTETTSLNANLSSGLLRGWRENNIISIRLEIE